MYQMATGTMTNRTEEAVVRKDYKWQMTSEQRPKRRKRVSPGHTVGKSVPS
jgi:hypothetical protein